MFYLGLAEREGFEPSIQLPAYCFSRAAPSTTRPPLRVVSTAYTLIKAFDRTQFGLCLNY